MGAAQSAAAAMPHAEFLQAAQGKHLNQSSFSRWMSPQTQQTKQPDAATVQQQSQQQKQSTPTPNMTTTNTTNVLKALGL